MRSTIDQHKLLALRPDLAAGAAGAEQQQHQCRRPDRRISVQQAAVVRGVGLIHSVGRHRATPCWPRTTASPVLRQRRGRRSRSAISRGWASPGQDNDDDIVQGIVLMRRGEQSMPTIQRGRSRGRADQQLRHPAARRAYRADLRPHRPDQRHHPHRAAQHAGGHHADLPACSGCSWAICAAR